MPCTIKLVDVPIRETVPPRMATKDNGIRYNDGGAPARSASATKTGRKTITTAVLLRKGDNTATITQSTKTRILSLPSEAVCAQRPIAATNPVLRSPSPSTSIAATATVASLLNPERASRGVRIPPSNKSTGMVKLTWSSRSRSIEKRIRASTVSSKTNTISNVIKKCSGKTTLRASQRGRI